MKPILTLCFVVFSTLLLAQSPGDTIVVESFNYTQTHGQPWDGTIRDTMIDFPDDPEITFERVIMLYNMRCKKGLVSTTSDRNKGCGEWDYSCNTYITDSTRVDSLLSFMSSHSIANFSGDDYSYIETPTYNYYQYRQKNVQLDGTNSETLSQVGNGTTALSEVIMANQHSGRSQYLLTQAELSAAGVLAGDINGILLDASSAADAGYFMINIKPTNKTELNASTPDLDGFTEVYFHDYTFSTGSNRIQFHTPFVWDGTSNLIVEFSFTNNIESSALDITGDVTTMVSGLYANNGVSIDNVYGDIEIPTDPFSTISEEITISFWSYGNEKIQPINNSFLHGVDGNGSRTVNVHLPWSNSNVYWDCGNDGGSYDRIYTAATADQYEGQWNHWAATKNTSTGEMHLYHNGTLWLSGSEKTLPIDIQNLVLGNTQAGTSQYFGKIDEVRIWDTELSESTINEWMYKTLDNTHPNYSSLVAYYKIDEGSGTTTMDASTFGKTAEINGYMYWMYDRGNSLNRNFTQTMNRPNITFAQGDYNLTITDDIITDSVANSPNIVTEYEIIPRWGTMQNDSINPVSVNEFWEAVYEVTFNPEGVAIDSTMVEATGSIEPTELTYYRRYPMKFEIMSFVTPYGINIDFGMDGKTWAFDVTDYTPILQGKKRMTVERGGQWQEDMDIKFLFIVGTPAHDVIDVQQLWRPDSKGYNTILEDRAFEARDVPLHADGKQFKIRSMITGHGQQGEFIPRNHFLEINGNKEFTWQLWTECSTNPIYPQGGTWIYDRAGWCPGQATDLYEYDITDMVSAGQTANINYGLETASGTSNYIVNNQLVTYGEANFNLDASVSQVLKPNSTDAKNERFNPACTQPEIVIQNTGKTTLTSLNIEYLEEGGESITIPWTGSLKFMEVDTVVLFINDNTFWLPTSNVFVVTVSDPNGGQDENPINNTYKTHFDGVDIFPESETILIKCYTNNFGWQNNYTLYDGEGDVYMEWDDLDNNTLYETYLDLPAGCYKLQINDKADDGLSWWHNSNQGEGYLIVKDNFGNILYEFESEFGRFAVYEFGIGEITSNKELNSPLTIDAYPNPTSDRLNIRIKGTEDEKLKFILSNAVSSVVFEEENNLSGGTYNDALDISHLPSGVYLLQIQCGNKSLVKKIIKK